MQKSLLALILIFPLSGCRTLGSFNASPLSGFSTSSFQESSYQNSEAYYVRKKLDSEVENCVHLGEVRGGFIEHEARKLKADCVVVSHSDKSEETVAHYYDCSQINSYRHELAKKKARSHDNNDFSLLAGKYIDRHGVLKKLGRMGPTLGFEYASFTSSIDARNYDAGSRGTHGFYLTWTFDHFWKTKANVLLPEFKDQDYTNYLFGGGYAYRYAFDHFQFHYRGGLAFNFIEIDTFRSNSDGDDDRYTDLTLSTIHRLGFDYLIKRAKQGDIFNSSQIRVGPSLFYYFAPDPLGKFRLTKQQKSLSPGGSISILLNVTFEFY